MSRSLTNRQNHPDRCTNCKKEDHTRDRCWFLYPHLGPRGWKVAEKKRMEESKGCASGSNGSGDQMQQFLQQLIMWLANQNQSSSSCGIVSHSQNLNLFDKIIIDSGATDHMFGNEKFLTNIRLTKNNHYVKVANGMKEKINYIGEIDICNKKINNVLFVKTFPINLLSVGQLTQDFNCNVVFSSKNVIFQERETGNKIFEGFLENGHYF